MTSLPKWKPEDAVSGPVKTRLEALEKLGSDASPKVYMLAFLEIISQLKHTERTGWVDRKLPNPESIADHMYRMSIICFFNDTPGIDVAKCQQIALCHDMAEALVGDITPYDSSCNKDEKHRREQVTMQYLRDLVSKFNPRAGQQIYDLWCEYEFQTSAEAKFVKDVDKFELVSQCSEYMRQFPETDIAEIQGAKKHIKSDQVKSWADDLQTYDQLG